MRILLLSLYYKPLNNIASTRIVAFKKYLEEFGHQVDVLTRHYSENELKKSNLLIAMTNGDDFEGDYYKKGNVIYSKYKTTNSKLNFSKKLPKGIKGLYNLWQFDIFHYSYVEYGLKAFDEELSNNKYDFILASSPPPVTLLLAEKISKKYNIPWVADFRDSFILSEDTKKVKFVKKQTLNKVLKTSSGISFVSEGMKAQNLNFFNSKNQHIKNTIIYNGFISGSENVNQTVIDEFQTIKQNYDKVLLYTGSIYKERNLDFFLDALVKINNQNAAVVCVGIQDEFKRDILNKYSDKLNLFIFDKTDYSTSIQLQNLADFLLLTIWKGNYTGFSGKVFEYLSAKTLVLIDKNPPEDLKDFLTPYNNNIIYCDEKIDVLKKALESDVQYSSISKEQIDNLSRKQQVKNLEQFLLKI